MIRTAAIVASILIAMAFGSTSAHAETNELDPRITHALAELPGGIASSNTTAEWPTLGIKFNVGPVSTFSVGSCANGLVCAYSASGLGGTRVTFSGGCTSWATTAFGTVRSVANARTSGWVDARNSAGVTLSNIGYNGWANVSDTTTKLVCGGSGITF